MNYPNSNSSLIAQPERKICWITATPKSVSDHIMLHLITSYRQKLKLCKPVVRMSKLWNSEAVGNLQACLDCTDWDAFRTATNSLDEYTEDVTSYINFCEDCWIPSRSRVSYNSYKRLQKEDSFRSGDRDRVKKSKYSFSKAVREAKQQYSEARSIRKHSLA